MGALQQLACCMCLLQPTESAWCVLTPSKETKQHLSVWGDGGLDLPYSNNATPRPCIPQSHRVTTTVGFFGPPPAAHLKASSPFSHMQAELPASFLASPIDRIM